jgi:hypothetical protein
MKALVMGFFNIRTFGPTATPHSNSLTLAEANDLLSWTNEASDKN